MIRQINEIPPEEHNETRLRRAKSWLEQSRKVDSEDEKFILLWIAFNAAYGSAPDVTGQDNPSEIRQVGEFLGRVIHHDKQQERKIRAMLWEGGGKPIRDILEHPYIFKPLWEFVHGDSKKDWRKEFNATNKEIWKEYEQGNVRAVFREVFWRVYQLRNQVLHGGTTFGTGRGRSQIEQGLAFMELIVPLIIEVMEANPRTKWGNISYPHIGSGPDEDILGAEAK